MRIRRAVVVCLTAAAMAAFSLGPSHAQTRTKGSAATVQADLGQLMRGIFYPNSNVIFAAQSRNPDEIQPASESSTATDPLQSAYGKWLAVENSALAIVEASNLLTLSGRKCANGRDVPLKNSDWSQYVQGMREAGMKAYAAAKSKNQDNILDAADVLTTACANCHDKYRETAKLSDRCM
jgi:hypothetical protein